MTKPSIPHWDSDETNNDEPPASKKAGGHQAKRPEAAQYVNWLFVRAWRWFRGLQHGYADIVVGSAAQVTAKEATHTVATFVAAISAGDTVVFLDGVHTLVRNEDITEADVEIIPEDSTAILAFGGFTFTMSGARARIKDGLLLSGAGAGDLILSVAGSHALVSGAAYSVFALSGGAVGEILGEVHVIESTARIKRNTLTIPDGQGITGLTHKDGTGDTRSSNGTILSILNKAPLFNDDELIRGRAVGSASGSPNMDLKITFVASSVSVTLPTSASSWVADFTVSRQSSSIALLFVEFRVYDASFALVAQTGNVISIGSLDMDVNDYDFLLEVANYVAGLANCQSFHVEHLS